MATTPAADRPIADEQGPDEQGPIIVSCAIAPGHDGRAEVVAELLYPNGGRSWLSIAEEALGRAVDAAGVNTLDELTGQPWTVLLAGMDTQGLLGPDQPRIPAPAPA